jgi:uncharacterized protein
MKHATPAPPELGEHDGLAYALFLPEGQPQLGVVICHGAGSAKESHFDFARLCRSSGVAALAFDARGHGRSGGRLGAGALDDVRSMCDLLRGHAPEVALRGSSMGGFMAIHAAARDADVCGVAAICPASEELLLRGLRRGELEFECDREATEQWLSRLDLREAVGRLGPRTALLLLHARGDERVPAALSEELYELAAEPKRLLILPGGHHRSLQHDMEIQALSLRFLVDAAQARRSR